MINSVFSFEIASVIFVFSLSGLFGIMLLQFALSSILSLIWFCVFAIVQMYLSHAISQLSNDWDSDPDVRESCWALKPARGAALLPVGCWVCVHVTAHSELDHTSICHQYYIWFGCEFSEQDSVWFYHHHRRTWKYVIVLQQVWVWSQWRLPVRRGTLLGWDGH